jgi:hypothetical protein
MPDDANGKPLAQGDKITIPATVTQVWDHNDYCNIRVEFDHFMPPYESKSEFDLNSKQVEKRDPDQSAGS